MIELLSILLTLKSTPGKNDKIALLQKHQGNPLLREVLYFLYNSAVLTGISKRSLHKPFTLDTEFKDKQYQQLLANGYARTDIRNLLDYFKEHNTGRGIDIAMCQRYLNDLAATLPELIQQSGCCFSTVEMLEMCEHIVTKSAKLGFDSKTINLAWGKNFIPTWEVQQAYSIEKYPVKSGEWFALTEKLNGNRCTYREGKLVSRQGKEFSGLQHILEAIKANGYQDYFLDGELIRKNTDGRADNENFRLGTGLLNSDVPNKTAIKFVVFECIPLDEMQPDGTSLMPYRHRMRYLEKMGQRIQNEHLEALPILYKGTDCSVIEDWLERMVQQDKEGLMLNRNTVYKPKRHAGICKIKRFYTMDLPIIGVQEGEGRLAGALGALVVDFKGNPVHVGSGFSDEDRRNYYSQKNTLIGKLAEVKYKEISQDKTGKASLQFPVFVRIREDKNMPSFG